MRREDRLVITIDGSGRFPGVERIAKVVFDDGEVAIERVRDNAYRFRGMVPCLIHYVDDQGKMGVSRQEIPFEGETRLPFPWDDQASSVTAEIADVRGEYRLDAESHVLEQTVDITLLFSVEVSAGPARGQSSPAGWAKRLRNLRPPRREEVARASMPPAGQGSAAYERWCALPHPVSPGEPGLLAPQPGPDARGARAAGPGGGERAAGTKAPPRGELSLAPGGLKGGGARTLSRAEWENPRLGAGSRTGGFVPSWLNPEEFHGWQTFHLTQQDRSDIPALGDDKSDETLTKRRDDKRDEKRTAVGPTPSQAKEKVEGVRESERLSQRERESAGREKERGAERTSAEPGGPGTGRRRTDDIIVWESWPKARDRYSRR